MYILLILLLLINFGLGILLMINIISYNQFLILVSLSAFFICVYCSFKCYQMKKKDMSVITFILAIFQFLIFLSCL